jgi:glyoxylase-like metal-dependent hydrolase (beta-lactamase superfamily II)
MLANDSFRRAAGLKRKRRLPTPGHTSGSICLYEYKSKVLFSGDTVFAGGTLSYIAESGSLGDYINSIIRLEARKITEIYPGHGAISKNPEQDLSQAILNGKKLLNGEENLSVSSFRPPFELGVSPG